MSAGFEPVEKIRVRFGVTVWVVFNVITVKLINVSVRVMFKVRLG